MWVGWWVVGRMVGCGKGPGSWVGWWEGSQVPGPG